MGTSNAVVLPCTGALGVRLFCVPSRGKLYSFARLVPQPHAVTQQLSLLPPLWPVLRPWPPLTLLHYDPPAWCPTGRTLRP